MSLLLDITSWICIVSGSFLLVIGGIGIIRLPDFYSRLHGGGITDTMGAGLLMTGLMVQSSGWGMNPQSVIPSNMHKAMQACRSYGVSYGGNDDVKYDALHDMKKIIAREFKLNAD